MKQLVTARKAVYFLFVFTIVIECAISMLSLPSFIRYFSDVALVGISVLAIFRLVYYKSDKKMLFLVIYLFIFLLYAIAITFGQNVSFFKFIWGFRTFFKGFLILLSAAIFLKPDDKQKVTNLTFKIFYISCALSFIQYLMGYKNDFNGGVFGIEKGCNAGQNVLLLVVTILGVNNFFEKKINLRKTLMILFLCIMCSVFAELKIYFFELIIILAYFILFSKRGIKKIAFLMISALVIFLLFYIMTMINPNFADFLSQAGLEKYLSDSGYTNSGDINRTNGIRILSELFFYKGNLSNANQLFGFGWGAASLSSISIFNTEFAVKYEYLHYSWFAYSLIFLESGLIGLVLTLGVFIIIFMSSKNLVTRIVCMMAMVLLFYNNSLLGSGIVGGANQLVYMFLSFPYIKTISRKQHSQTINVINN